MHTYWNAETMSPKKIKKKSHKYVKEEKDLASFISFKDSKMPNKFSNKFFIKIQVLEELYEKYNHSIVLVIIFLNASKKYTE